MAVKWITPAGNLGIITERVITEIPIEATSLDGNITYKIIAGDLPRGLRLLNNIILGSPVEVSKFTESRFVIRASDGFDIEDRTFSLSVDGADIPEWITREGFLQVGQGKTFFILDNARVNFQLEATDSDLTAGDVLEYYLMPMGGELPPGLTLSKDGLISGFTDPIFAIDYSIRGDGGYDVNPFDITPLDFREARTNGFDSFFYDQFGFDYNEPSRIPRRLSRIYNFVVAVTDGLHVVTRLFKIYVVTEEFLQADNSIVQISTNVFTADNTNNRIPIWITESNLGQFRANNYVTIFLEVYRPPTLPGSVSYVLLPTNSDGTESRIPQGLSLDSTTGQLAGKVPYQTRITESYTFSMLAVYFPSIAVARNYVLKGDWNSAQAYFVNDAVRFLGIIYVCIKAHRNRSPSDREFWISTVSTVEKTFTVSIFGEIDSGIEWISNSNLGTIKPNQASKLFVEARSLLYGGRVTYAIIKGSLPPGLTFLPNGLIQGKIKQFADSDGPGLTRFFDPTEEDGQLINNFSITFDGGVTSFDKEFKFTIKVRDGVNFAELEKEFFFTVIAESDKTFANLFLKAFQAKENRLTWYNFITDVNIFSQEDLYRYGDPNFAVQTEIKVLLYAGIESVEAVKYVQAMSRNHYRKRLLFGSIKSAVALDPDTQEPVYETIYVDIVDEFEKNNVSISNTVNLRNNINSPVLISYDNIRVDSDIPFVSDRDHQRVFPNSLRNMRRRIKEVGERDREYLPLWMRSIQPDDFFETGFVKALVLCYVKPGRSETVLAKIRAAGFDFKNIDFVADRYLIDIIDGEIQDKYLAFPQRDILNKLSNPSQIIDTEFSVILSTFDNDLAFFDSNSITFDQE